MLQHGVHFGHQQSRRHPKMAEAIFDTRHGISIINLEQTQAALGRAAAFLRDLVANGKTVLFVGTKRQAQSSIQEAAQRVSMPYVVERWIGGLFTNFATVRQLIATLQRLKEERAAGGWAKYTKKEQLGLQGELERLDRLVGGLGSMEALPAAVFIVDIKTEKTAVAEAKKVGIPVVALCDTNVNPAAIAYPIPANDDATKSIKLLTDAIVESVMAGQQQLQQSQAAVTATTATADEAATARTVSNP
ncbi:MAG: 30S ribosomal protein S2 [Candidatus Kerfeldbacteria bacterium]|nr:30S ribosomal protein S2 [Candidatus Kerfeldbacteria bacterium]